MAPARHNRPGQNGRCCPNKCSKVSPGQHTIVNSKRVKKSGAVQAPFCPTMIQPQMSARRSTPQCYVWSGGITEAPTTFQPWDG